MRIKIGKRYIGDSESLYFIADIAANHDGDIGRALRLVELAKESGADAAKFQNFQASKIVSRCGFESLGGKFSHQATWKKPVFEVYQDASIDLEWTEKLRKHCDLVGIEYMTSPYDFESVNHVDPYVNAYKIGSGDITWHQMLEYIASKGKPVLLATGAASWDEVKSAIGVLRKLSKQIILMQCNTNYSGKVDNLKYINLNVLKRYAKHFPDVVLGLSDHSPGCSTVLGAVALGARVFEKHFTDDKSREGPDHNFSVSPLEWREMVEKANEVYRALGDGVKRIEDNERETSILQKRALRYKSDLCKNHIIKENDIFPLRPIPEGALPPYEIKKIIGKRLLKNVKDQDCVLWEDI